MNTRLDEELTRRWGNTPPLVARWIWIPITAIVLVALICAFTVTRDSVASARLTACLGNLEGLSSASLMYAADHDDRLPRDLWMDADYMYTRTHRDEHCPEASVGAPNNFGYSMSSRLLGSEVAAVADPSNAPLTFDSTSLGRNTVGDLSNLPAPGRHNGVDNVAYLNGHAHETSATGGAK